MLPSNYNPTTVDGFIGPARVCAQAIDRLLAMARKDMDPIRIVLSGKPGIGKSKLATYAVAALGCAQWNLLKLNGTEADIEAVARLARDWAHTSFFPGYRCVQLEEIDKMPAVARSRMLTLCDDMLPGRALIATTNLTADAMRSLHPATQRRYTWFELEPPTDQEVAAFLTTHWPEIPACQANAIAMVAQGCVGLALQEADAWLSQTFQQAA